MSMQQLLDDEIITFDQAFSDEQKQKIISALHLLYKDDPVDVGSVEASNIFDSVRANGKVLHFEYKSQSAEAFPSSHVVSIDPDLTIYYVNDQGSVVDGGLERLVMHEVVHAVLGLLDPRQDLTGAVIDPNYRGDTVDKTNSILQDLAQDERLSYAGADLIGNSLDYLTLGENLTNGNDIDLFLTASEGTVSDSGTQLPGPDINTSRNEEKIRDLIMDPANLDNLIATGQGNDFIYAYGGNDFIRGGSGDDYIHGGSGEDAALYYHNDQDAGPISNVGIYAELRFGVDTVFDGYGGSDTLTSVEVIVGSARDDIFEIIGSLSAVATETVELTADAYNENDTLVDDLEENGDTLILSVSDSETVVVLGDNQGSIQIEEDSIAITGFENVIGSEQSDEVHGNLEDNDITTEGGNDTVFGSLGSDVLSGGENSNGTEDNDTLSYANLTSGVRISVHEEAFGDTAAVFSATDVNDPSLWEDRFTNFETIILNNQANVIEFDPAFYDLQIEGNYTFKADDALEEGHLLDGSKLDEGFEITLEEPDGSAGSISSHGATLTLANFDNVTGSEHADTITGGSGRNNLRGGDEGDTIDGGEGHDEIHGGLGNDIITGGAGADFIYDRGVDDGIREGESLDQYVGRTLAYDGEGNDEIRAGDGSDILVYSGGTDTYYGGKGNDLYTATELAGISNAASDNLTIVLGDDGADFGHDLIQGDGRFVDSVRFEGFNTTDVIVKYNFTEVPLATEVVDFDPIFGWFYDPEPVTLHHYATVGTIEIIAGANASLTIENVIGFHTKDGDGHATSLAPSLSIPFELEFDNGLLDWTTAVSDPSNGNLTLKSSALSSTAFAALGALEAERSVVAETITGAVDVSNDLYGSIETELLIGGDLDDNLFGGGANDILIGGLGADHLDGGSGIDTASYANATSGVRVDVSEGSTSLSGEDAGDVFVSIENLTGSDFDDVLSGDDGNNVLRGGLGNDELLGSSGDNELYGGGGNDQLTSSFGNNILDGGAGDDTIETWTGYDQVYGGDGDDLLINRGHASFEYVSGQGWVTTYAVGNGIYDGGDGVDTFQTLSPLDAEIDLTAGQAVWAETGDTIRLVSIENVEASDGNDTIYGNDVANVLNGGDGDDTIYGGGGNDILIGGEGDNRLFGGSGIDTARINGVSTTATYDVVDGGIRVTIDTSHPDYVFPMDEGTFIIFDDVEFIEFNDVTLSYAGIAGPLLTEFEVIDDYFRADEGGSSVIDLTDNDIEAGGGSISVVTVNGTTMAVDQVLRLNSGATLTLLADGTLEFDQGGAYAWLEPGQTATETVTYTATDSTGVEKTGSVTLVVDGIASNPDALHLERNVFVTTTDQDKAARTAIANFNIAKSLIVVDELYVDPNNPPAGVTIEEINGDTFVMFGGDDAIVLEDISLEAWKHAASNPYLPTAGNDNFTGTSGADVLIGGGGNDRLTGNEGDDYLLGGQGVDDLFGGNGHDELCGGTGNDDLYGGNGNDILVGGDGDDYFRGGFGQDTYDGGVGVDTVDLQDDFESINGPGARVDLNAGVVQWLDYQNGLERLLSIENVYGSSGEDILIGDDGNNHLDGVGGNDVLRGGAGDDILTDAYGNNTLYGGDGNDTLRSKGGADTLYGDAGDDILDGGAGDDSHYGGVGNDFVQGNVGADFFDGGEGIDTIDFSYSGNNFNLNLVASTAVFSSGFTEQVLNFENIIGGSGNNILTGSDVANVIDGAAGNDTLYGGEGNDTLDGGVGDDNHYGGAGDDLIFGNGGADFFDGGEGVDTIDFSYSSNNFSLSLTASNAIFESGFSEQVLNFENIIGGSGNNTLTGSTAGNVIDGGAGNDRITGLEGDDTLTGSSGADVFVFNTLVSEGADVITDFELNTDTLEMADVAYSDLSFIDTGSGTRVEWANGSVELEDIALASLTEDQFLFI